MCGQLIGLVKDTKSGYQDNVWKYDYNVTESESSDSKPTVKEGKRSHGEGGEGKGKKQKTGEQ